MAQAKPKPESQQPATAVGQEDAAQPETIGVLRVVAKREGFRRAGRAFGAAPTDIPLDQLNKAQLEQLKSDPMLVCVEADIKAGE